MAEADVRNHIDCTQGKVLLDGEVCIDATALTFTFTPEVSTTKTLGHTGEDTRWKGYKATCTLTEYRSKDWLKKAIKNFIEKGITPVFTIQGVATDTNSDYYLAGYGGSNGSLEGQTVTGTGCIPTGDINVLTLDANSEFMTDTITFNVKSLAL